MHLDWVKDAILERYRKSSVKSSISKDNSWRAWWNLTFETTESWFVIFLVGITKVKRKKGIEKS